MSESRKTTQGNSRTALVVFNIIGEQPQQFQPMQQGVNSLLASQKPATESQEADTSPQPSARLNDALNNSW
jgi:hypothetical protein